MPTLSDVNSVMGLVVFLLWCFAIWAIATAIFRSFPAAELWVKGWMNPERRKRIHRLQWELRQKREYDPRAEREDQMVKTRELSAPELAVRENELQIIRKNTFGMRAVAYFLSCTFCQNWWVSFLLVLMFSNWNVFWKDVVITSFSYTGVVTIVFSFITLPVTSGAGKKGCPSGNCGGGSRYR